MYYVCMNNPKEIKNVLVGFDLDGYKSIAAAAKNEDRSVNAQIRWACDEYCRRFTPRPKPTAAETT